MTLGSHNIEANSSSINEHNAEKILQTFKNKQILTQKEKSDVLNFVKYLDDKINHGTFTLEEEKILNEYKNFISERNISISNIKKTSQAEIKKIKNESVESRDYANYKPQQLESLSKKELEKVGLDYNASFEFVAKKIGFIGPSYNTAFKTKLRAFQKEKGISVDGIIGQQTILLISGFKIDSSFVTLSKYNKQISDFDNKVKLKTLTKKEKDDFIVLYKGIDSKKQTINNMLFQNSLAEYEKKYDDGFFTKVKDNKKVEVAEGVEELVKTDKKSADLWKVLGDKNVGFGDKFKAFFESGLGAGAFVAFIGVFLFTDEIMKGGFFKKLGMLAFGMTAYTLAKDDVIDGLNKLTPKDVGDGVSSTARTIKDGAVAATETISEAVSNAFDTVKAELGNPNLSDEAFAAVSSLSTGTNKFFKDSSEKVKGVYEHFVKDEKFKNLSIKDAKNLTNAKFEELGAKDGFLTITIDSKNEKLSKEDFQAFLTALITKEESGDKTIGDILESDIGGALGDAISWVGDAWNESSSGSKYIAAGTLALLAGHPLLGALVGGFSLSQNFTVVKTIAEVFGKEEYGKYIKGISDKIDSISDKKLQKKVTDLFQGHNTDLVEAQKLDKLIRATSGNDKKILEELQKDLARMIAEVTNSYMNKLKDFTSRSRNKNELEERLTYLNKIEKYIGEVGLDNSEKIKLLNKVKEAKMRLARYAKEKNIALKAAGLTSFEVSKGEYLNSSILDKKVKQLLGDMEVAKNDTLLLGTLEILNGHYSSEETIKKLTELNIKSKGNKKIAEIITLYQTDEETRKYGEKVDKLNIPNNLSEDGINTLLKDLYGINTEFNKSKLNIIPGYNYEEYQEKYLEKKVEIYKKASSIGMGQVIWGSKTLLLSELNKQITNERTEKTKPEDFNKLVKEVIDNSSKLEKILGLYQEIKNQRFKDISSYETDKTKVKQIIRDRINAVMKDIKIIEEKALKGGVILPNEENFFNIFKGLFNKFSGEFKELYENKVYQEIQSTLSNISKKVSDSKEVVKEKNLEFTEFKQDLEGFKDGPIKVLILNKIKKGEIKTTLDADNKLRSIMKATQKNNIELFNDAKHLLELLIK